jgi:hypothetical protein
VRHYPGKKSELRQVAFTDGKTALIGDTDGDKLALTTPYADSKFTMTRVWKMDFVDKKSAKPVDSLAVRKGDDFVEVDLPVSILKDKPKVLVLNWCRTQDGISIEKVLAGVPE